MAKKSKKKAKKGILRSLWKAFVWWCNDFLKLVRLLVGKSKKAAQKRKARQAQKDRLEKAVFQEFKPLRKKKGSLLKFQEYLFKNKSSIGIILGARGSGKSGLGMNLLENFAAKTQKNIYAMGFKQKDLPGWVQVISSIDQIHNNAVVLVDEGGITFSSRSAMSNANKLLSELLFIARHKDLTVLFITQNSSNLEINALRQADYLLLKPSSLLQKDFERKKIKDVYAEIQEEFEDFEDDKGAFYIYADKFRGYVSNKLPSFWSDNVSKGFAKK